MREKLNLFICAGMVRSGTTFMYHNLQKHFQLFVPYRPTDYFGGNNDRGVEWFENLFRDRKSEKYCVDISPCYSLDPGTVDRINAYSSDIAVLFGVRKPSSVAFSLYSQLSFTERLPSFYEFIESHRFLVGKKSLRDSILEASLKGGVLIDTVMAYQRAFGNKLLLYDYELFKKDTCIVLSAIEAFLGLEPFFEKRTYDDIMVNSSARKRFPIFDSIIRNDAFVSLLDSFVPRRLVQITRAKFERMRKPRTEGFMHRLPDNEKLLSYAREAFAEQDRTCASMFTDSQIILGNGKPFEFKTNIFSAC